MKLLITTLTMIFISFGAWAKDNPKIKMSKKLEYIKPEITNNKRYVNEPMEYTYCEKALMKGEVLSFHQEKSYYTIRYNQEIYTFNTFIGGDMFVIDRCRRVVR